MEDSKLVSETKQILGKMLELLGVDNSYTVSVKEDVDGRKFLEVIIDGDDVALLIGYRGKTLNSLQLLLNQIVLNKTETAIPVMVDINQYRERREQYLRSLAKRAAVEAKESQQDVELPPLSAYERRVVHLALSEDPEVETESAGEGSDRHIVIKITM